MTDRELFEEIFYSNTGGAERKCECGRIYYDNYNNYDAEWVGELREYEEKSAKEPDKYVGLDHSIGTVIVDRKEFVVDCRCNQIEKYRLFIENHAKPILKYLKAKSDKLKDEAASIDPEKYGSLLIENNI